MDRSRRRPILAASLTLAVAAPALVRRAKAGRDPTPEERSRVEAALRRLGYVQWEEIEFEDGVWEVDDARDAQGKEWDLKLRGDTLEVIAREED